MVHWNWQDLSSFRKLANLEHIYTNTTQYYPSILVLNLKGLKPNSQLVRRTSWNPVLSSSKNDKTHMSAGKCVSKRMWLTLPVVTRKIHVQQNWHIWHWQFQQLSQIQRHHQTNQIYAPCRSFGMESRLDISLLMQTSGSQLPPNPGPPLGAPMADPHQDFAQMPHDAMRGLCLHRICVSIPHV